jgi:hypothetical protein
LSQIIFIRRPQYPPNHFLSIAESRSTEGLCTTLSGMIFTGDSEIDATSTAYIGGRFCNRDAYRCRYLKRRFAAYSGIQRLDWYSDGNRTAVGGIYSTLNSSVCREQYSVLM